MANGVDYVNYNAGSGNASTSQALLASLSALRPSCLSSQAAAGSAGTSSLSHPPHSLHTLPNDQSICTLIKSAGKKTPKPNASKERATCEVCGKTYRGVKPLKSLKYHEAVTGHLQQRTKQRGIALSDLKVWLAKKAARDKERSKRQKTSLVAYCPRCGQAFRGKNAKYNAGSHSARVRYCRSMSANNPQSVTAVQLAVSESRQRSSEVLDREITHVVSIESDNQSYQRSSVSNSSPKPAHTVPSKVTAARPVQRRRKRSLGSLHSSEQESEESEGLWVSAVPANARPRTPDTTFSSHGKGKGRVNASGDPDATLFTPEILERNERGEKKNKRKRMQEWVNSFTATTDNESSQGVPSEQTISTSVDLQSYNEPAAEMPKITREEDSQANDRLDRRWKKRRKEGHPASSTSLVDLDPDHDVDHLGLPAHTPNDGSSVAEEEAGSHQLVQGPSISHTQALSETYWKAATFEDIVAMCFRYEARYANPWPESMHEEHFVTLTPASAKVSEAIRAGTPEESNEQAASNRRSSWLVDLKASVWSTLKRSGSAFSPRKVGGP